MPVYPDGSNPNQPAANPAVVASQSGQSGVEPADFYFFAHGLDFKKALAEFRMLSGPTPLVPRYAMGVWFSRWFGFDDEDMRRQQELFEVGFFDALRSGSF